MTNLVHRLNLLTRLSTGIGLLITLILGAICLTLVVVTPLDFRSQALFAVLTIIAMLLLKRFENPGTTLVLITLSIVVSTRYIWWRLTETMVFETYVEAFFGVGLFLAEIYAWLVLVLGYFQTVRPLNREPIAMPADIAAWPTVDIFIPTYNESLSIVADAVLAAQCIDYPHDRVNVYILDDGRREEFEQFAIRSGAGYITRADNQHAKAGNLNAALRRTEGEFIAIFDCDHVPTRSFLQMTMGWFGHNKNLALIQTPHHFYSPDPFERNLAEVANIPNEGLLFYSHVQDGNDFWNAAFFCGSCAILRRSSIEAIGGFAVETVTEDAHTALKLHRAGFDSAYLKLPMAAGLATERLALHVGQRMRWARGMVQIFRIDNPLFGPNLSLGQRLCYLNAMMHFFFAVPRIVFLTAPLAYLLFDQNIIAASALSVLIYAGPHLVHSTVTNSRIQGKYRHSFWGEIYESSLAFAILKPTLMTLWNPKKGKFNVTEKGGLLEKDFFDFKVVRPHIIISSILAIGLVAGMIRLFIYDLPIDEIQVLMLNVAWSVFNMITLLASIAVAREKRQIRKTVRVKTAVSAIIYLAGGQTLVTRSIDLSMGGGLFKLRKPEGYIDDDLIDVEFSTGITPALVPARIVSWNEDELRIAFDELSMGARRDLVRTVLGRADAWMDWEDRPADKPMRAFGEILRVIVEMLGSRKRRAPRPVAAPGMDPAATPVAATTAAPSVPEVEPLMIRPRVLTSILVAFGIAVLAGPAAAQPSSDTLSSGPTTPIQIAQAQPRGRQSPADADLDALRRAELQQSMVPSQQIAQTPPTPLQQGPSPTVTSPPAPAASATTTGLSKAAPGPARPGSPNVNQEVFSFRDLGAQAPIRLLGVSGDASLPFSIRRDEVVTGAKVNLSFAYSPSLLPDLSQLVVLMNGEVVSTIMLARDKADGTSVNLPINPVFFQEDNRIGLHFVGHYTTACEDPLHSSLWSVVSNNSFIQMDVERLPQQNDLAALPLPFYDKRDMRPLSLPFVFSSAPSNPTLQAAGIVSSWFGSIAQSKGATFPVSFDAIPQDNAVVFATPTERPAGLTLPRIDGPTLAVIANPNSTMGKLLLVMGRTPEELRVAAQTLTLGSTALSGQSSVVGTPVLAQRKAYDAPRWLASDRPVRLGEIVQPTDLQGVGINPGVLTVNFHSAPDLFIWRNAGIPLKTRYRFPAGDWLDKPTSRLDVSVNNSYLKSLPLTDDTALGVRDPLAPDFTLNEGAVEIPPFLFFGQNQLQFYYDLKPHRKGECQDILPTNIISSIDPDSTIDLSDVQHYTTLPNLAYFANTGFPMTKFADLGEAAVVMVDQPTQSDVEAYLDLMGTFGDSTGYPVLRSTVIRPDAINSVVNKDVVVIGTFAKQPLATNWAPYSHLKVENGQLRAQVSTTMERVFTALDWNGGASDRDSASQVLASAGTDFGALIALQSPLAQGRSAVMIVGAKPENLTQLVNTFRSRDLNPGVQGDLTILNGDKITSFRVGDTYTSGVLPFTTRIRYLLADKPLALIVFTLIGVALISIMLYGLLKRIATTRLRSSSR
ncbi:MAG TPA: UDP-forming cellulose synthase catalytic subunit [Stellaceae bacterium]|nr:UDP-forming cellulose synthase catalytic subunit [Stellaceae bacterium]